MPGIVGFISKSPHLVAASQLHEMLKTINRESFYTSGTFVDEILGLHVGWTALKGSFSEKMPLCDSQKKVALVFSGEDYSYAGTQACDPEPQYLADMYGGDSNFFTNLNGMFHGLVADRTRGTISLSMIAMGCTAFATMSRPIASISRVRRRPFWPCARNSGSAIRVESESL